MQWMVGLELTRDPRYFHPIKVARRALRAEDPEFPGLERRAWAALEQALRSHPDIRKNILRRKPAVPNKLHLTFERPAGAPLGARPESKFVKLPRRTVSALMEMARERGIPLDQFIKEALERGLKEVCSQPPEVALQRLMGDEERG